MRMHGLLFKPVINTRRHDFIVAIEEEEEKKKGSKMKISVNMME